MEKRLKQILLLQVEYNWLESRLAAANGSWAKSFIQKQLNILKEKIDKKVIEDSC